VLSCPGALPEGVKVAVDLLGCVVKFIFEVCGHPFGEPVEANYFYTYKVFLPRNVARMGEMRNVYKVLVGKSEGKRPLGRLCGRIIL
jgi:hypothetical protein